MDLLKFKEEALNSLQQITSPEALEQWRSKFLSRKSVLAQFFESLKYLSTEERKIMGQRANEIKLILEQNYQEKKQQLEQHESRKQPFDITRPGIRIERGHLHPLTLISRQLIKTFEKLGFDIALSSEIETEYYNFDALGIPANHPARDMWDTFWLESKSEKHQNKLLLRTHTSPIQIHYMETHQPPFRMIAPGRCFRFEATDSYHDFQFHQLEGLVVSRDISLANFKQLTIDILNDIFDYKIDIRFRPSYFPFVTPGLEVDIRLKSNKKQSRQWLEVIGAGMVHPDLFKRVKYLDDQWQGFAFGLGIERIAMIKYGIDDIRLFFNSDLRFLKQF